jgi:hypothetical protein
MSHPPFNRWLLDEAALSEENDRLLHEHLQGCVECRQLHQNWLAVHQTLTQPEQAAPAPNFALRWRLSLPQRRMEQQKQLLRRFLGGLGLLVAFTLGLMGFFGLPMLSPASTLVSGTRVITDLVTGWHYFQLSIVTWATSSPLPVILWIVFSTGLGLLCLVWVLTMWRISRKGVKVNETD